MPVWIVLLLVYLVVMHLSGLDAQAQQSNVHAAGTIETTGNLGYTNPIIGVTVGGDLRKGNFVLSLDAEIDRVRKRSGGAGYSIAGRESLRYFVGARFFVQGGAVEQHYAVTQFDKSSFSAFAGAGFTTANAVYQFNYRQDFAETSHPRGAPNSRKIVEAEGQWFLSHHFYLTASGGIVHFEAPRGTGIAVKFGFGFHS